MQPEKLKSPQRTLQTMLLGYAKISSSKFLNSNGLFHKAFIMLGNTKAGKTTIFHTLAQNVLYGEKGDRQNIVYNVREPSEDMKECKIGKIQTMSETNIPNITELAIGDEKIAVIDLAGFLDSFGCYRSISNKLFMRLVFSKIQNAKFVIACQYNDTRGIANNFKKTIESFLHMFHGYTHLLQSIIKSVCIVITGVPSTVNEEQLGQKLSSIQMNKQVDRACYKKLITELKQKKRIFKFQAAVLDSPHKDHSLRDKILNSGEAWWSRNVEKYGLIDLGDMAITVSDSVSVSDDKSFMQELKPFSDYLKQVFQSDIKAVFKKFVSDFIDQVYSQKEFNCLKLAKEYLQNKQTQIRNSKDQQLIKLYVKYKKFINKPSQELFKALIKKPLSQIQSSYSSASQLQSSPVLSHLALSRSQSQPQPQFQSQSSSSCQKQLITVSMKKIRAFIKINQISSNVTNQRYDTSKGIRYCYEQFENILAAILRLLEKQKQNKDTSVIQFAYNLISKSSIFILIYQILHSSASQLNYLKAGSTLPSQFQYMIQEFPKAFQSLFNFNLKQPLTCCLRFLADIQVVDRVVNYQRYGHYMMDVLKVVNSFNGVSLDDQDLKHQEKYQLVRRLKLKLQEFNFKTCQYQIHTQLQPQPKTLKKLLTLHHQHTKLHKTSPIPSIPSIPPIPSIPSVPTPEQSQNYLSFKFQIFHLIAHYAKKTGKNEQALQLYEKLNDGHNVMEMLRREEERLWKEYDGKKYESKQRMIGLWRRFMEVGFVYGRVDVVEDKGQRAFSFAQTIGDIQALQFIGQFMAKIPQPFNPNPQKNQNIQNSEQTINEQFQTYFQNLKRRRVNYKKLMKKGLFPIQITNQFLEKLMK